MEVQADEALKATKAKQWDAATASAPTLLQSTADAMAMFAVGGVSAKLKRKISAAAILTMDRASKVATSGLRAKGMRELDAEE